MPSNALRRSLWIIVLLGLAWVVVFTLDLMPNLRGGAGWRWLRVFPPEHPERLLIFVVAVCGYLAGAWWFVKRHRAVWLILWAVIACIGLTVAAQYVRVNDLRYELYTRTVSSLTTGWHYSAADIDELGGARAALSRWPEIMLSYIGISGHVAVSPPGLSMAYYAANKVFAQMPTLASWLARPLRVDQCHNYRFLDYSDAELASAWFGMLMPLWGSLTVPAVYWLGQSAYTEQTGRWGALIWPLVPAFLMFTPHPSTVFPMMSTVALGMLIEGQRRNQLLWIVASGIMMSGLSYVSYSFLPLIFLAGLVILGSLLIDRVEKRHDWQQLLTVSLAFGIGLVAIWGINTILSGLFPWEVFAGIRDEHFTLDRPYLPWVFFHLNDFFMFTGWPVILVAGLGVWQVAKALREKGSLVAGGVLTLAGAATVIILDVSGIGRGESGRVWLLLSPFFVLMAATILGQTKPGYLAWLIVGTQAMAAMVMVGSLHVIDSGLTAPPDTPPPLAEMPETDPIVSGAIFGDALRLESFTGHIEIVTDDNNTPAPVLVLWLDWQSVGQVDHPYYLSFIPVSPESHPTQATLSQPFGGSYPTTCWLPESGLMQDRFEIPLFSDDATGGWWVSLSLVNGNTGDKLDVTLPDGSSDDQAGIGPFSLHSP
jgi:hypothetical protein